MLAAAPAATADDADIRAAGVIAYTEIQGQTYVLLAEHRNNSRGWGTFGGRRDPGESVREAARREFREETRCVYDDAELAPLDPGRRRDRGGFAAFVLEVPFVPAPVFERARERDGCRGKAFRERGPWIWVPVAALVELLNDRGPHRLPKAYVPDGQSRGLWAEAAKGLRDALAQGWLAPRPTGPPP
ncbi:MAG: NUDIX domain-containing protein [Proteobacteria bacterium]|nr:NUDIX domain-containing protein [Pseudomonadota bacterium]